MTIVHTTTTLKAATLPVESCDRTVFRLVTTNLSDLLEALNSLPPTFSWHGQNEGVFDAYLAWEAATRQLIQEIDSCGGQIGEAA